MTSAWHISKLKCSFCFQWNTPSIGHMSALKVLSSCCFKNSETLKRWLMENAYKPQAKCWLILQTITTLWQGRPTHCAYPQRDGQAEFASSCATYWHKFWYALKTYTVAGSLGCRLWNLFQISVVHLLRTL